MFSGRRYQEPIADHGPAGYGAPAPGQRPVVQPGVMDRAWSIGNMTRPSYPAYYTDVPTYPYRHDAGPRGYEKQDADKKVIIICHSPADKHVDAIVSVVLNVI